MTAIEITVISIATLLLLFAFGPKFVSMCEILGELLVDSTIGWIVDTLDDWKDLLKRWFNKK